MLSGVTDARGREGSARSRRGRLRREALPCARPPHPGDGRARERRPLDATRSARGARPNRDPASRPRVAAATEHGCASSSTSSTCSLLNASYGVDAVDRLCDCVEERLRRRRLRSSRCSAGSAPRPSWGRSWPLPALSVGRDGARDCTGRWPFPRSSTVGGSRSPRAWVSRSSPSASDADALLTPRRGRGRARRAIAVSRSSSTTASAVDPHGCSRSSLADAASAIHRGAAPRRVPAAARPRHRRVASASRRSRAGSTRRTATCRRRSSSRLAERMDLIDELGAHVLRRACADVAQLRRRPAPSGPARVGECVGGRVTRLRVSSARRHARWRRRACRRRRFASRSPSP